MRSFYILLPLFSLILPNPGLYCQQPDISDFRLGGEAVVTGDNCIQLTPDREWASGSIWYKEAIGLNAPFEMELKVMLGCKDGSGADGIVFVFHPYAQRTGYQGEGMGFAGLEPSLGIEIDTWLNEHLGDPLADHIALLRDGQVDHRFSLKKPVAIPNIEDCRQHPMKVSWSPDEQRLRILLDGKTVLTYEGDIVDRVFKGNSKVYWGVTAATGAFSNRQAICFDKLEFTKAEDIPPLELSGKKAGLLLKGEIITLDNLQFESGSATLLPLSKAELDRLALLMKHHPGLNLDIFGHTDNVGSAGANQALSQRRSEAVARYLMDKGIPRHRLRPKGFGELYPIASNDTPAGRLKNRRVAFRLSRPVP
ncbi:MAG: OmpA family protein [Phaeodactylibacter sp.]|nr:OmpA family protein [Phaeodactylibacter sp.]MCB9276781.1 OmpA family protein [Lewinellaceae bacterium]